MAMSLEVPWEVRVGNEKRYKDQLEQCNIKKLGSWGYGKQQ